MILTKIYGLKLYYNFKAWNTKNYCFYRVSAEDNKIYNYSILYRVKNADSTKDAFSRLIDDIENFEFIF